MEAAERMEESAEDMTAADTAPRSTKYIYISKGAFILNRTSEYLIHLQMKNYVFSAVDGLNINMFSPNLVITNT